MPVVNMHVAEWKSLALAGRWDELLYAIKVLEHEQPIVLSTLWKIKALRALKRGAEANSQLLSTLQNGRRIEAALVPELCEELVQCAYFNEVMVLANQLVKAQQPVGHFIKASIYRELGHWQLAHQSLDQLNSQTDGWPRLVSIGRGWVWLRQGHLKLAKESLQPFSEDPSPATQKLLARLEFALGKLPEATIRLDKIAERQPLDWEWPTLMAAARASLGESLTYCLALVEQGLSRQPRQSEAYALLAQIKLSLGDEKGARKAAAEALAIKPWNDAAVLLFVERAASQRKFTEARTILKRACGISKTPRREVAVLDIMRLEGAKVGETVTLAHTFSEKFPDDPDVLRTVAAAFQACRRTDPAALTLEKVLELNPFDKAAKNNLAVLYRDRGDIDDAINLWRDLSDLGEIPATLNLAQTLTERGDFAEAEKIWNAIESSKFSRSAIVYRGRASLYTRRGEVHEAMREISHAIELEPANAKNWIQKASLLQIESGSKTAADTLQEVEGKVDNPLLLRQTLFGLWRSQLTPGELLNKVKKWVTKNPLEIEYHFMFAKALQLAGRWDEVDNVLIRAVHLDPREGNSAYIRYLLSTGRLDDALRVAKQWTIDDPSEVRRWAQLAEVYFTQHRLEDAQNAVSEGLSRDPNRISLVRQKLAILNALEKYNEAVELAKELWLSKKEISALSLWLKALERANRYEEAVLEIKNITAQFPNQRAFKLRLARQLSRVGEEQESINVLLDLFYDEPNSDTVAQQLIVALSRNDQSEKAMQVMQRFSEAQPHRLDLQVAMARICLDNGLTEKAEEVANNIRKKTPDRLDAWLLSIDIARKTENAAQEKELWLQVSDIFPVERWVGNAISHWARLGLESELEQRLNAWRTNEPTNAAPWRAALAAAQQLNRHNVALELLDGIERRLGATAEVNSIRANILGDKFFISKGIAEAKEACRLAPIKPKYLEQLIGLNLKAGDWSTFDDDLQRLEFLLVENKSEAHARMFFNLNCHPTWSALEIFKKYKEWDRHVVKPSVIPKRRFKNVVDPRRKLRIGYISPDFRRHVVAKFSEPILRYHDKENFELYGYAYLEHQQSDDFTQRFKSYVDHWREIQHWSTNELEKQIRKDSIDILIDLAGHTAHNSLSVFARRPAPILATHIIGAGQTSGMSVVDYLITSGDIWPKYFDNCASERVERIPYSGLVFQIPEDAPHPKALPCLINDYITFGVFARPVRTNQRVIAAWSEILHKVPNSRLRFEHSPYIETDIQKRFIQQFETQGIGPERLDFSHTRPYWDAFDQIDIQLDPFPAGSASTSTEGLYMERLVVALSDRPGMGRMAAEQLLALGLAETCVAFSEEDYINKAVELAKDPSRLATLSAGLRERFERSSITDYDCYAKLLGAAYRLWWRDWCEAQ
jgi:protein O-GlcNAc transferase